MEVELNALVIEPEALPMLEEIVNRAILHTDDQNELNHYTALLFSIQEAIHLNRDLYNKAVKKFLKKNGEDKKQK